MKNGGGKQVRTWESTINSFESFANSLCYRNIESSLALASVNLLVSKMLFPRCSGDTYCTDCCSGWDRQLVRITLGIC